MIALSTSKMSSRGQIVIPESIRERLGIKHGTQFVIMGEGDTIILKTITPPSLKDFGKILAGTAAAAKKEGMKPADISQSIKNYRAQKKQS